MKILYSLNRCALLNTALRGPYLLMVFMVNKMQVYDDGEVAKPVGVTAMVGLLPQAASGLPSSDAPRLVPLERWDVDDIQRGSPVSLEARFGAFVNGADAFDGAIFGISR